MANKEINIAYDQIPHIVINHPETTPEHKEIIRALFKVLKDVSRPIIYTNESLSKNCNISLRSVERRIPELVKMGFISCTGRGYNRRISLGLLFNNTAKLADRGGEKLNNSAKSAVTTANMAVHNRQYGGDYNPYTKHSTKEDLPSSSTPNPQTPTLSDFQNYAWHSKNNKHGIPEDLKWVKDFI